MTNNPYKRLRLHIYWVGCNLCKDAGRQGSAAAGSGRHGLEGILMAACRSKPGPRQSGGAAAKTGDDCRLLIADCGGRKSKLENRNSAPLGCSSVSCEFRISSFEFRTLAIGNRKSAITKSGEGFFSIMLESLWIADTDFW